MGLGSQRPPTSDCPLESRLGCRGTSGVSWWEPNSQGSASGLWTGQGQRVGRCPAMGHLGLNRPLGPWLLLRGRPRLCHGAPHPWNTASLPSWALWGAQPLCHSQKGPQHLLPASLRLDPSPQAVRWEETWDLGGGLVPPHGGGQGWGELFRVHPAGVWGLSAESLASPSTPCSPSQVRPRVPGRRVTRERAPEI